MSKQQRTLAIVAAAVGVVGLVACQHRDRTSDQGAVVTSVELSREEGTENHSVTCSTPGGREFEVDIPAATAYDPALDGKPCPAGPRRPTAKDRDPELYAELSKAVNTPGRYAGGDVHTACGAWETDDEQIARQMVAECPPLTRGDLP